ncbi:MAG: MBL fold metallo-hydrolase [Candidatus Nomurabacteria bacterium]|jgi:hypothetical protein|nr:MBL fold metallo-hydrolase [Candidatus Nomurabacteria bacterium]
MFEIELKNPDEISIKTKERSIDINIERSTISAGLSVGAISGAGEFEIGDAMITAVAVGSGSVMYRVELYGITVGVIGLNVKIEELDDLGPIDILGTSDSKVAGVIEPKIIIPMGSMDYSELKASIIHEKKLKIKNASSLPPITEIYKLD